MYKRIWMSIGARLVMCRLRGLGSLLDLETGDNLGLMRFAILLSSLSS